MYLVHPQFLVPASLSHFQSVQQKANRIHSVIFHIPFAPPQRRKARLVRNIHVTMRKQSAAPLIVTPVSTFCIPHFVVNLQLRYLPAAPDPLPPPLLVGLKLQPPSRATLSRSRRSLSHSSRVRRSSPLQFAELVRARNRCCLSLARNTFSRSSGGIGPKITSGSMSCCDSRI